jgi:hypothetical protein
MSRDAEEVEGSGDVGDPQQLITRFETVVRELIRSVLGDGWHKETGIDLEKLEEKRTFEKSRRPGAIVSEDLLDYTEHLQLGKIIQKRWQDFSSILGNKKRWDVYSDRIAALRNTPMHARELLHFERHLLAGMTGEIGNIVAMHRSTQGPDEAWYPVVESVVDSFGNVLGRRISENFNTRLAVGDVVRFRCVGHDPQDRELHWRIFAASQGRTLATGVGADVDLVWEVGRQDVSERFQLVFTMKSDGEFHRHGDKDVSFVAGYAVSPPMPGVP